MNGRTRGRLKVLDLHKYPHVFVKKPHLKKKTIWGMKFKIGKDKRTVKVKSGEEGAGILDYQKGIFTKFIGRSHYGFPDLQELREWYSLQLKAAKLFPKNLVPAEKLIHGKHYSERKKRMEELGESEHFDIKKVLDHYEKRKFPENMIVLESKLIHSDVKRGEIDPNGEIEEILKDGYSSPNLTFSLKALGEFLKIAKKKNLHGIFELVRKGKELTFNPKLEKIIDEILKIQKKEGLLGVHYANKGFTKRGVLEFLKITHMREKEYFDYVMKHGEEEFIFWRRKLNDSVLITAFSNFQKKFFSDVKYCEDLTALISKIGREKVVERLGQNHVFEEGLEFSNFRAAYTDFRVGKLVGFNELETTLRELYNGGARIGHPEYNFILVPISREEFEKSHLVKSFYGNRKIPFGVTKVGEKYFRIVFSTTETLYARKGLERKLGKNARKVGMKKEAIFKTLFEKEFDFKKLDLVVSEITEKIEKIMGRGIIKEAFLQDRTSLESYLLRALYKFRKKISTYENDKTMAEIRILQVLKDMRKGEMFYDSGDFMHIQGYYESFSNESRRIIQNYVKEYNKIVRKYNLHEKRFYNKTPFNELNFLSRKQGIFEALENLIFYKKLRRGFLD